MLEVPFLDENLFDRDKHEFRLHPELGPKAIVTVSIHPVTGQTAFIQASEKAWWSDTLGLLAPAGTIQLPGERLYKARWLSCSSPSTTAVPPARKQRRSETGG